MWMYHNVASLLVQPVSVHKINKFMFILKVRLPIWPRTQWIRKLSFETEEAQTRAEKNGLLESSVEWMDKRKCIFAWFPTMRLPFSDYFSSIVVQCNRIPLQCRRRRRRLFHFSLPCYYFLSSVCTVSSLPTKVVQDYRDNIGRAKSEKKNSNDIILALSFLALFFELSSWDSFGAKETEKHGLYWRLKNFSFRTTRYNHRKSGYTIHPYSYHIPWIVGRKTENEAHTECGFS